MSINSSDNPSLSENSIKLKNSIPSLTSLEKYIILYIFENSCCKLDILKQLLPCRDLTWDMQYINLPSRLKISKLVVPPEDIPSERDLQLSKIQQCVYLVKTLFDTTIKNIALNKPYETIQDFIISENLMNLDEIMIQTEHNTLTEEINSLQNKILELEQKTENDLLELDKRSQDNEQAIINAWVEQKTAESYVNHIETTRLNQTNLQLKEKEDSLTNQIIDYTQKINNENIVHVEIEEFLIRTKDELDNQLDEWTQRYNKEIDQFDIEILQMKKKRDEQKEDMNNMLQLFNSRQEEMDELQKFVDEREKEHEEQLKQTNAATKIQNWWRRFWLKYKKLQAAKKKNKKKK